MSIATLTPPTTSYWGSLSAYTCTQSHTLLGRTQLVDETWQPVHPSLPVLDYARRTLAALGTDVLGGQGLSEGTKLEVLEFLRNVSDKRTTFPSIAPDEDGIAVLHWVAGDMVLQVDVDESGPIYMWAKYGRLGARTIDGPQSLMYALSKSMLARMAEIAAHLNPGWRAKYFAA